MHLIVELILLLEREHISKGDEIGTQQRARARVLRIEHIHVIWAYETVAIVIHQLEAKLKLLTLTLGHQMGLHAAKKLGVVDLAPAREVQDRDKFFGHSLVVFLTRHNTKTTIRHEVGESPSGIGDLLSKGRQEAGFLRY